MLRRLREERNDLGAALRHVSPLPNDQLRKQRVRYALSRAAARPRARWHLALTGVVGVLLVSAFASAMRGHFFMRAPRAEMLPVSETPAPTFSRTHVTTATIPAVVATMPRAMPSTTSRPGATLMLEAMHALRDGRNPRVADEKASRYLRGNGNGPLAEEAYAIVLEAKVARKDPAAENVAADYLRRFPDGRFVDLARGIAGTP